MRNHNSAQYLSLFSFLGLAIQTSTIKYQLIHQFYGIEEFLDMVTPLPSLIDRLDDADSEFVLLRMVKDLDVWFIRVQGADNRETWNPLKEPLFEFTQCNPMMVAHQYPKRRINEKDFISYTRKWEIAC